MGDPDGFVELSVYAIVVAIALPLIQPLRAISPFWATAYLAFAIFPIPAWLLCNRFELPDWFARLVVWNCWIVLAGNAIAAIASVASKLSF